MRTDLYEQAYDNAWAEVIKTTDPLDECFDALLLKTYERLLIKLLHKEPVHPVHVKLGLPLTQLESTP